MGAITRINESIGKAEEKGTTSVEERNEEKKGDEGEDDDAKGYESCTVVPHNLLHVGLPV